MSTKAKSKKGAKAAVPTTAAAATDIDDIFASGPSKKAAPVVAETTTKSKSKKRKSEPEAESSVAKGNGEEKKKKKKKAEDSEPEKKKKKDKADPTPTPAAPTVLEVVDPSVAVAAAVSKAKAASVAPSSKKRDSKAVEEDRAFRDSRGDSNRECGAGLARSSHTGCSTRPAAR